MQKENTISTSELNEKISWVTNKVAFAGEYFVITKHGKPVAEIRPVKKSENESPKKSA